MQFFSSSRQESSVVEAMARARTRAAERAAEKVAKSGKVAKGVREEKRAGGSKGIRWIAEPKHGPYKCRPYQVAEVRKDGSVVAKAITPQAARRGLRATFARSLRKWGKAPKEERDSWLRRYRGGRSDEAKRSGYSSGTTAREDKGPLIYPGDVYLDGIPMINQGRTAYCAVASAARVLQSYGIEITMEDMAVLAGSSVTGGTNRRRWDQALSKVARDHGLELKEVEELSERFTPLSQLMYDYNHTARKMGYEEVRTWDYLRPGLEDYRSFWYDREYPVVREMVVSDTKKRDAFDENVIGRINDSDPLFWCVTTGDVPEEIPHLNMTALSAKRSSHMRLIIGYNEDRGEVLYSDSWGEGHELKRMDGLDALSITTGMYYLTDKP